MVVGIDKSSDPDGIWATGVLDKDKSVTDRVDQFTADSDRYNDSAFSTDKRTDWTSGLGPGQKAGEGQTSVSDQLSRRRGTSRGTYSFGRGPTGTTGEVGRTSASAFRGNPYTAYSKRPVVRAEERESGIGPREEKKRDEIVRPATRDLGDTPKATRTEFLRPDEVGTSRDTEAMQRKYGENFQETEGYKSEVRAFDYSPEPEVFLASATGRFAGLGTGQNRDETQVANLSNLNRNKQQLYETMEQVGVGEVTDQDWINRNKPEYDPSADGTKYFKKGFFPGTGQWVDKEQRTIQHGYNDPATGQTRKTYTEAEYLQEYGYGQYGNATYDRELKESYRRNWEQQNPGQDFDAENLMSQNYTPPEKEFNPRTGPPDVPTKNQKLAYATPDTEDISYRYTSDTGGYYNEFGEFIPSLKVNPGDQTAYAGPLEGDTSNKKASSDIAFNSDLDRWINKTYGGAAANWYRNNPGLPSSSNPYLPAGAYVPQASVEKSDDTLVASSGDLTGLLSEKTSPEVSGDESNAYQGEPKSWHTMNDQERSDYVEWMDQQNAESKRTPEEGFLDKKVKELEEYEPPSQPYATEEEPFGNYIKNEDTGEVIKLGEGMDTSPTTDLNSQSSQSSQPTAREHNRNQGPHWTSGYYRNQSVDNIIRDGYSQSEANQIKAHIAEGDRIEAQAEAMDPQIDAAYQEYQRKSDYAQNYLGGKTEGTQDEYNEAMRRYAAADAASARWNALLEQQMEIRSRGSKHTDALSQYL